jgi:hypothetical protein
MKGNVVALASEFPNDNPRLHRGVIWVCLHVTGPAVAEAAADEAPPEPARVTDIDCTALALPVVHDDPGDPTDEIIVEELGLFDVAVEGVEAHAPPDPGDEPPLTTVARDADERPARVSEIVLCGAARDARDADADVPPAPAGPFTILVGALVDVASAAGAGDVAAVLPELLLHGRAPADGPLAAALRAAGLVEGTRIAPSLAIAIAGWRAILGGTSDDFSACGTGMLDEWAADLLARLLGTPARALRQELRRRGVAAFGLVEAA